MMNEYQKVAAIVKAVYDERDALLVRMVELESVFAYLNDQGVFDGFVHLRKDRHDYAMEIAEDRGHDEPTPEDSRDGFIRMCMEAME